MTTDNPLQEATPAVEAAERERVTLLKELRETAPWAPKEIAALLLEAAAYIEKGKP